MDICKDCCCYPILYYFLNGLKQIKVDYLRIQHQKGGKKKEKQKKFFMSYMFISLLLQ